MQKFKRKRLLIDPEVQGALIKRNLMYWVFGCIAILTMMTVWKTVFASTSLTTAFQSAIGQCFPIFVFSLLILPVVLFDTLRTSNRVAGPLYRLRKEMSNLEQGANEDQQPLKFREGDFWNDLANQYNRLMNKVRSQDQRLKDYFDKSQEKMPESIDSENVKETQRV